MSIFSESTASSHENGAANNAPQPDSDSDFSVPVDAILSRADITSFRLSWGEQERADRTPKVSRSAFARIFGARLCLDWVKCRGDCKEFFYAKLSAQPFAPTSIGGRGLALLGPAGTDTQGDEEGFDLFHVFVASGVANFNGHTMVGYMGDYTIVPLQQHVDWSLLPEMCKTTWLKRLFGKSNSGRVLSARIQLRSILNREPSVAEVRARLRDVQYDKQISWGQLKTAFEKGEEKLRAVGIQCKRYDSHLAAIISEK